MNSGSERRGILDVRAALLHLPAGAGEQSGKSPVPGLRPDPGPLQRYTAPLQSLGESGLLSSPQRGEVLDSDEHEDLQILDVPTLLLALTRRQRRICHASYMRRHPRVPRTGTGQRPPSGVAANYAQAEGDT